jgi:hypothetical protein
MELFLGIRRPEHEADLLFVFSDGVKMCEPAYFHLSRPSSWLLGSGTASSLPFYVEGREIEKERKKERHSYKFDLHVTRSTTLARNVE